MVQEGAKQWGAGNSDKDEDDDDEDEGSSNAQRQRRLVNRGRKSLAFLEDEDGEETD